MVAVQLQQVLLLATTVINLVLAAAEMISKTMILFHHQFSMTQLIGLLTAIIS